MIPRWKPKVAYAVSERAHILSGDQDFWTQKASWHVWHPLPMQRQAGSGFYMCHLRKTAKTAYQEQQEFYQEEEGLHMDLSLDGVLHQPRANIPPTGP